MISGNDTLIGLPGAHDGQRHVVVPGDFLDHVAEIDPQIGADIHHALIIHGRVAHARDDVPLLERVAGCIIVGLMYDNAGYRFVQLQEAAQRGVLQRLQVIEELELAIVVTIGDVLQEQLDFLIGNDVADILGIAQATEREAYHPVAGDRRSAAVARIDGRVDLDPQSRGRIVVGHEFNARHDALGDGQRGTAGGKAVGEHRILDLRQGTGARQRRVRGEEAVVIEFQYCEIDARCDGFHGGRDLVAGTGALDLHLTGIQYGVRVGQDPMPLDDDS